MITKMHFRIVGLVAVTTLVVLGVIAVAAVGALAAKPELTLQSSYVDSTGAGEPFLIQVTVVNSGDATSHGPITFTANQDPGLSLSSVEQFRTSVEFPEIPEEESQPTVCETTGLTVTCNLSEALPPDARLMAYLKFEAEPGATGALASRMTVSGGESSPSSVQRTVTIGPPQEFGISELTAQFTGPGRLLGAQTLQAGSDPADFTTAVRFPTANRDFAGLSHFGTPVEHPKDVLAHLPAGLVGNPTSPAATCTAGQLALAVKGGAFEKGVNGCPVDSQVGMVRLYLSGLPYEVGLFNMVAPPGYATELGFQVLGTVITVDAYLRPGDSGIDIVSRDVSTTIAVTEVAVTVWGDPQAHSHDRLRGYCDRGGVGATGATCPTKAPEKAFLRLPTTCSGTGMPFAAGADSYEHPGREATISFTGPALTGCERVPFDPSFDLKPTSSSATSDTGVAVKLSLPQATNPEGLWEADLKKAVVTLPEGMTINPSSADGLQTCTDAQLRIGLAGPSECPEASKVGRLELHTPLLENAIEGSIWLRPQNSSDPASGELFRIAIELRDDRHGIDIKVPGQIAANPVTGQLTTTFDGAPQLPFEDLTLHFKAGARSPLTTPSSCGKHTGEADLYSWAQPDVAVRSEVSFQITSGPEGTGCVSPSRFTPAFDAGVSSVQAGGFTPFLATFSRGDADQSMQKVSVKMPQGLLGSLVGLPLCGEAQANAGTCPQASEIGTMTAGAGAGPTPYYVTGGKVFMTGPYEGAPFGLSVVVPAKAGPFDLGTVVVRAKVEVDVHTAQLTVTTDPLPQIVGGVPVNLRLVNVTINRPNFTYNPTNCDPTTVSGTMTGGQGATAALSNHFQVTNCGALGFKPKFTVSTSGKTSRANGASLDAKLAYPKNLGQANIARVKVDLPKQLPSRLTTLQKACTAQTFETNPAACPAPSKIGTATAVTPVLPVPLSGPVYFVSHGGEAFPDLVVVLQGYGVTVNLVGTTFISKAGITSTTFKTVPDVPVGTFELKLPQGKYSALAANGNLCKSTLKMPTSFVAQDGAEMHQSTPITVSGCAKHKAKKLGKHNKKK